MAASISPNQAILQKQKAMLASRLQSPPSPFMLGSNNDQLERAQARAARAAAIRRMSIQASNVPTVRGDTELDDCLGKQQILELFQNCIKLASENKINQKNTWELTLIDHLTEIVKVEDENDSETNFQKASCTLEAGVKIYSLRVDSVHSEAYKVLGGMNRAGQAEGQDTIVENASAEGGQTVHSKKETDRKLSPLSTLESSFETLNLKKIDVAFAVDPLYHQTSAQFDEGGAKGLLLNNLGVYDRCRVLFDSLEVPGKCVPCNDQHNISDGIDLSFARECIEEMVLNMRMKDDISPTLRTIIEHFDEDNSRPSNSFSCVEQSEGGAVYNDVDFDGEDIENCGNWNNDQDHVSTLVDESLGCADSASPNYNEENEACFSYDPDTNDKLEKVDAYLFLSLGLTSKQNFWAGPDHWKYRKTKGSEVDPSTENELQLTTKRKKNKKQAEPEIDFTEALEKEMLDIFAPPKNPKSLILPASRAPCNTKLPEDCHYQPEDLVKLFLLPCIKCLGKRGRNSSDGSKQNFDDYGQLPSWDDETVHDGIFDDGVVHSDAEDSSTLVSQPRQVNKIEVQYDKTSKQVDVQALKETLWDRIQESQQISIQDQEEDSISFKQILASFPNNCRAAATVDEISPHLCFICLLHLANEHGLSIHGHTNFDDLTVHLSL